jgi:ribonucleotide reductase beta subunit family protein with ferritin-like domain
MENVPAEAYSLLIQMILTAVSEHTHVSSSRQSKHSPVFGVKSTGPFAGATATASWCAFSESLLVVFTAVEGIFFSGAFCAIFWLNKQHGILPDLCFINELISCDEGMHCDFTCLQHNPLVYYPAPLTNIHLIICDAVNIE